LPLLRTALAVATVVALTPGAATGAVRTWDGGDPSQRWSAPANWSGDAAPVAGDAVVFDGTSARNATLDVDLHGLASLTISGYAGTLASDAGNHTLAVAGDFVQTSGAFVAPTYLIVDGRFARTGGTFQAAGGTVFLTSRPAQTHRTVATTFHALNISDSLIAYWPLDSSAAPISDLSGGGTDLSVQGTLASHSPAPTSFPNPRGLDFNNDAALSATYPSLLRTPNWTVSLWFRADLSFFGTGSCGGMGADGPGGDLLSASGDYFLRACKENGGPNRIRLSFRTSSGNKDCLTTRTFIADDGNYHHVAATSDALNNRVVYLDGVPTSCAGNDPQTFTSDPLTLARHETDSTYYFDGSLDEVRIYGRGLTAAELLPLTRGDHPSAPAAVQTFAERLVVTGDLVVASRSVAVAEAPTVGGSIHTYGGSITVIAADAGVGGDATAADATAPVDPPSSDGGGLAGTDSGPIPPPDSDVAMPDVDAAAPGFDAATDAPIAMPPGDGGAPSPISVKLAVGCACHQGGQGRPQGGVLLILVALALRRRR
jgi:MYXO-CTERM domain-containing protein